MARSTTKTRSGEYAAQGEFIHRARRRLGLSQEEFAPEVGTTRRHLIRIENGEHRPSREILVNIAARLSVEPEELGYPADDEAPFPGRAG